MGASKGVSDFLHVCAAFTAAISQGPCILLIDGIDELVGSCGLSPQQVGSLYVTNWAEYFPHGNFTSVTDIGAVYISHTAHSTCQFYGGTIRHSSKLHI